MRDATPHLSNAKKIFGVLVLTATLILIWVLVPGRRAGEPPLQAAASQQEFENTDVCSVDPPITSVQSLAATIEQVRSRLQSQAPASADRAVTLNNRGYNYPDARTRVD